MAKSQINKKPASKPGFSKTDKILDTAGWFALATLVLVTVFTYFHVQDIIPVHFNAMGRPDGFGNKIMLFAVLGIACLIFFSITLSVKYVFNPVQATAVPNKKLNFAIRIVRFLKLIVTIGFIYIMVMTNLISDRLASGLGSFFLPAVVISLLFPVAYFFKKTLREKMMKK
jgi:magnesium-transporting ATPase (P-type)